MIDTMLLRKWIFFGIIAGLIVPHISLAANSSTEELTELQRYFWYDGSQKRSVWVNPELMAEFKVQTETNVQLKTFGTVKEVNAQPYFVRFLKNSGVSNKAVEKKLDKNANSQFSPVLHDAASIFGMKRALPGNVLVQMKPGWSQQKITAWFEEKNVVIIKSLTFAPNAFLVQSKPGLDSLNIANRIYETGEVILASPNWWQKMVAR